ncbi:MAG: carbon-nitrogen hydrolase family protein [Paracoccaceae bacterium]
MRAGLVQLCSGDDPGANLPQTLEFIRESAGHGAGLVLTPEVTNCVSSDRARQSDVLAHEADDQTLKALQAEAEALGIWLVIGSLALKTSDPDGRFANRGFVIGPRGQIAARYDKMHMFDVSVSEAETYRESKGYRPGDQAVICETDLGRIGMSICYDLRFAALYRALAKAGAQILTVPAAFSRVTGAAHWEPLLRARAIENGAYVLAPAQCGENSKGRATYGHSMAVSPWGEVLIDGGEAPGVSIVDIDLAEVASARARIPSLQHDRAFSGPDIAGEGGV